MTRHFVFSILAAAVAVLPALTAMAQEGFEVGFSSSELVLASDGDPTVLHIESWDSPLVRLAERNMPFIELTNTSTNGETLTEFRMTIGDTLFNFSDAFLGAFAVVGVTTPNVQLTATTEMNGDELVVQFNNGGLAAGDVARFMVDIDRDDPDSGFLYPDYRTVFFDLLANGATGSNADNSQTTATFSTGTSLTLIIDDQPKEPGTFVNEVRPYTMMEDVELYQAIVAGVVPEPAAIAFVTIAGAVGVGARRRRSG